MKRLMFFVLLSLALVCQVHADLYTASRAVIRVTVNEGRSSGVGSGIVVGSDNSHYYALTNAHVATTEKLEVEFFDAGTITKCSGVTVMRDESVDLAVIKINTNGYNPAIVPIDPNYTLSKNEVLASIGHPEGGMPTCYFCSYKGRDETMGVYYTPPPKQGRSGSPLLSTDGNRVVGIVYGYLTNAPNYGLAVPADTVADFVRAGMTGTKRESKWVIPKNKGVFKLTDSKSILENSPELIDTVQEGPSAEYQVPPPTTKRKWFFNRRLRGPIELPKIQSPIILPDSWKIKPKQGPVLDNGENVPGLSIHDIVNNDRADITLCQYYWPQTYYSVPYYTTQCPGGSCPAPDTGGGAIGKTPRSPIAVEILGEDKKTETPEKKKEVQTQDPSEIKKLEQKLEKLESSISALVDFLREQAESEATAFTPRTNISDGIESGIKDGVSQLSGIVDKHLIPLTNDWTETTKDVRSLLQAAENEVVNVSSTLAETKNAVVRAQGNIQAFTEKTSADIHVLISAVGVCLAILCAAGTLLIICEIYKQLRNKNVSSE